MDKERNRRMGLYKGFYKSIMEDIGRGIDCFKELQEVKLDLQSQEKIDKTSLS